MVETSIGNRGCGGVEIDRIVYVELGGSRVGDVRYVSSIIRI